VETVRDNLFDSGDEVIGIRVAECFGSCVVILMGVDECFGSCVVILMGVEECFGSGVVVGSIGDGSFLLSVSRSGVSFSSSDLMSTDMGECSKPPVP
jgi:hypothetical protein